MIKQHKIIKTYIVAGLFVAIISVFISVFTLTTSNAYTGTALETTEKYQITFDRISDIYKDKDTINIIKNPTIVNNTISYGVAFYNPNEFTKFQFEIKNNGNTNAKIKKIEILNVKEYLDYIDINIKGIEEGQIIEAGTKLDVIEVITTYKNAYLNEENMILPIELNDIIIKIDIEKE